MDVQKRNWIAWLAAATTLSAGKLWLVGSQSLYVQADGIYDDRLFLNLAESLGNGNWLGDYNQMTLVKGMVFPLWISLVSSLQIPILTAQHVLYIAMCLLFGFAIRQALPNPVGGIILLTLLIFNPMSYSAHVMPVAQREGIYPALTLFLLASLFLGTRSWRESLLVQVFRGILAGLALALFWMTREEGIWILPAMTAVLAGITWKYMRHREGFHRFPLFPAVCIGVASACLLAVCMLNRMHYKVFTLNELKESSFQQAYRLMSNVQNDSKNPVVPIPKSTREMLYTVSPRFSELEGYITSAEKSLEDLHRFHLENYGLNPDYTRFVDYFIQHLPPEDIWRRSFQEGDFYDDINGAVFVWIFRDAVSAAGHHRSAAEAAQYYRSLADDIHAAWDQGKIICENNRIPFIPPMDSSQIPLLGKAVLSGWMYLWNFDGFTAETAPSEGSETSLAFARRILRERLVPVTLALDGRIWIPTGETMKLDVVDQNGSRRIRSILLPTNVGDSSTETFFTLETRCVSGCYLALSDGRGTIFRHPLPGTPQPTRNISLPLQIDGITYRHGNAWDAIRLSILDKIGSVYQIMFTFAGPIALLLFLYHLTRALLYHQKIGLYELVLITLFLGLSSRIGLLSVVHITSFPAIISRYFAPIYPMYIAFVFLSFFRLIQSFTSPDRHLYPERAG
jgi:hypothetical protein